MPRVTAGCCLKRLQEEKKLENINISSSRYMFLFPDIMRFRPNDSAFILKHFTVTYCNEEGERDEKTKNVRIIIYIKNVLYYYGKSESKQPIAN